ncbi:MAG: transcription repressor NadR [Clostridia bacterium]|nr:transcription repressor NadR [Clostridia bacterium]
MNAETRRGEILSLIANSDGPVPANVLKERMGVSRQIIVADVAALRAKGYDVIATNKGYVLSSAPMATRVFKCRHSLEDIVPEAEIIIERGGVIQDIYVNHRVYGKISARLDLKTKTDAEELLRSLRSGASKPLMSVTDGYHYHTVMASTEEALFDMENALRRAGYLIEI